MLEELKISNFRIISDLEATFTKKNIFIGDNAQGKTAILEAIYYLAFTKSFRGKSKQALQFEKAFLKIAGKTDEYTLKLIETANDIKLSKNDVVIRKRTNYIGNLLVLLFSPNDLELVSSEPSYKRKFINMTYGLLDNQYLDDLNMYNRLLKERNIILKETKLDFIMLDLLTASLVEYHDKIHQKRKKFIDDINFIIKDIHKSLADESLVLEYISEDNLADRLKEKQAYDILTKTTNYGVHRDNIKFYLNGLDANLFASQGQIRTILLSLNLALINYIKESKKKYPILLLDDVFSELDANRIKNLFAYLNEEIQVFITATDLKQIKDIDFKDTKVFEINDGAIIKETYYGK